MPTNVDKQQMKKQLTNKYDDLVIRFFDHINDKNYDDMIEERGVDGVLEMIDEYNDTMDFVRELGGRPVSYLKNKIDHEMKTTELEDQVRSNATAKLTNIMTK